MNCCTKHEVKKNNRQVLRNLDEFMKLQSIDWLGLSDGSKCILFSYQTSLSGPRKKFCSRD